MFRPSRKKSKSCTLSLFVTWGLALVMAWLAFGLSGCSYFFSDESSEKSAMELQDESLQCVHEIDDQVKAWAESSDADLVPAIDCALAAMDRFKERTRGQDAGGWSKAELENFLKTYMKTEETGWVSEVLTVKQALLGGSEEKLSREELDRVREFLVRAKEILPKLSSHGRIILFKAGQAKAEDVEEAALGVEKIADILADELSKSDPKRAPFLIAKVEELASSFAGDAVTVRSLLPLASAAKAIAVGGEGSKITAAEWPVVARSVGRLWAVGLRVHYQLWKSDADLLGKELPRVQTILERVTTALDEAVTAQGKVGLITNERLAALITELGQRDLLPGEISASALNEYLPVLFGKILHGNAIADRREKAAGLGHTHVKVLRETARDWLEGQKMILALLNGNEEQDAESLARALGQPLAQDEGAIGKRVHVQLLDLLSRGRPLVRDGEGRLLVVRRSASPRMARKDLNFLNAVRAGAALVLRGYAHDWQAAQGTDGLTENEVQEAYLDARQIGRDMRIMDSRQTNSGTRTFMEGNVFMSVSDGDARMSLHETVEWLYFVISGSAQAEQIYKSMVDDCGVDATDVFARRKLRADCFRERFQSEFATRFANLPGLVSWLTGAKDRSDREMKLQKALENASRMMGYSELPIEFTELRTMVPILSYVENTFAVHDVNANEILDTDELWGTFKLIQPSIRKMAKGKAEAEFIQKGIFSWLLTMGEPPQQGFEGSALLAGWSAAHYLYRESAERIDIMRVISSLAVATRQERGKRLREYIRSRGDALRTELENGEERTMRELTEIFQCQPRAAEAYKNLLKEKASEIVPMNGMNAKKSSFMNDWIPNWVSGVNADESLDLIASRLISHLLTEPVINKGCIPF